MLLDPFSHTPARSGFPSAARGIESRWLAAGVGPAAGVAPTPAPPNGIHPTRPTTPAVTMERTTAFFTCRSPGWTEAFRYCPLLFGPRRNVRPSASTMSLADARLRDAS